MAVGTNVKFVTADTDLGFHLLHTIKTSLLNIGIRFDVSDARRFRRATNKVYTRAKYWIEDEMQRQCAIKLANNIYIAIKFGKYSYQPYNLRYENWKNTYFPGKPFWELKGDLAKALQAFKTPRGNWAAGVPAGIMDSGGKSWFGTGDKGRPKEIAMYGSINERLRPLWKPESEAFIDEAFIDNDWRQQARMALKEIGKGWN